MAGDTGAFSIWRKELTLSCSEVLSMKALILNSGLGSRMGVLTSEHPKCMTEISPRETILSRQLNQLSEAGIRDVVITTGYYDRILVD